MTEFVLEVLDGELKGRVISLGSARLTLGRRPNNDVVLRDEKASSNHAEIVREGDAWVLRDLDSRNGTYLDGRKITEMSLSPGDVFKIGLTAVCFRRESDAAVAVDDAGDAEGMSVHRIDQARLQRVKRGGGMLGMVVVLIAVVGAAAWVWFRFGGDRGSGQPRGQTARAVIAGNLLSPEASALDDEAAWDTGAGGVGFAVGVSGRRGGNALTASRDASGAPFALARLKEPLRVLGDDLLEVSAQVRCEGGATVALRVSFASSHEDEPFTLTAGTPAQGTDAWDKIASSLTVPAGLDRARLELVALLPTADAVAHVDDVAVVRSGGGQGGTLTAKNGVRLLVSGASAAIVLGKDVLLQAVRPAPAAGTPLAAMDAVTHATLAEAGGSLRGGVEEDRFSLLVEGVDRFVLEFPASDGLMLRAAPDAAFVPSAADFAGEASEFLIGSGGTRLLCTSARAVALQGRPAASGYQIEVAAAGGELGLIVGFEGERREARERVRMARVEVQGGRFAPALASLQEVATRFPHDDAVLADAQQLRADILATLSGKLDKLAQDLEVAKFFAARSGLSRVQSDLDDLVRVYGEENLGRPELVQRVRTEAGEMIAELDAQQVAQRAAGLRRLAEAMQQTGGTQLAAVIESYLKQHERKK